MTTVTADKVCLVTIVTPGLSDRVIKIFPAELEAEKIWLDTAPGQRRWDAVERLMNNHAERGTAVPKPAPYHSSSKDLRHKDLKDEDIPRVNLEGNAFLKAPIVEKRPENMPQADSNQALSARMAKMDETLHNLMSSLASVTAQLSAKNAQEQIESEPKKKGRPAKAE